MTTLACLLGGYLAGSIPFAILVSRAMGLPDPRTYGSGNIGTTNVLRSGSKIAAILTLVGDAGKGWAAVFVAQGLGADAEQSALVGFGAFVGHVYPVWLRFHGGKGVATAAGVLLALDWRVGLAVLAAWLAIVVVSRYSSLAALVGAAVAPGAAWYFAGAGPMLAAVAAMSALLVLRHRANIGKLWRGEESRIGEKKAAAAN
ncbi:MAG TPA: glycerol-3-phosphate 1-O-acyltransferase PlsY [Usitatibacter sp.]|nr:glycerol-3-phosphate 1-O-acyltransferase PlsY [Usitatibacter sp.]